MKSLLGMWAAMFCAVASSLAASASRPNIIFILADDLGIGNVSSYGADHYQTPNIDRLAADGLRFTHCYTAPLCGPSRALILTGRYAFRTGATNQDATGQMKPEVETFLPTYLRPAGYVTASIGKWGQLPLGPREFGFDDEFRFRGSGVYWNAGKQAEKYWVNGEEKKLGDREYMPDLMHEHLVQFITQHREQPFYVYYSMSQVHGELQRTPDSGLHPDDLMADNCAYMDKLVGKLVGELDRLKLRERTLLVFMGDNGTGQKQAERSTIGGRRLSGQKGSMLECGSLVPFIANWPGTVPKGKTCADLLDASDLVPTFAALAGATLPAGKVLDGRSFAPQLRGEPGRPREHVFMQLAREWWVREAGWKLNQAGELFDMSDAPFAEKPVAPSADRDASKAARARLTAVLATLNPAEGILDQGDGSGRHADKSKKKKGAAPEASPPVKRAATSAASASASEERATRFDRIDRDKHGQLTLEEYATRQSDADGARKRFKKFDVNQDGIVTRAEYIAGGR